MSDYFVVIHNVVLWEVHVEFDPQLKDVYREPEHGEQEDHNSDHFTGTFTSTVTTGTTVSASTTSTFTILKRNEKLTLKL